MKKILKILLIIIIVLAVVVLAGGLLMPKEIILKESIVIKAEKELIFHYVNCLEKTALWSPWEGVGEIQYGSTKCGVGAMQEWKDDKGVGKQEIIEVIGSEYSKSALDFGPQGTAEAEFKLEPSEGGTKVTWTFKSEAKYPLGRWISTLFVKPMLAENYKKGLTNLDSLILSLPPQQKLVEYNEPTVIEVESKTMLSFRETVKTEDIGPKMGEFYVSLMQFMGQNKIKMAGPPIAIWHEWNDTESDMECAIYAEGEAEGNNLIKSSKSYAGKVVVLDYYGAYNKSSDSWQKLFEYAYSQALQENGPPWDEYITDPSSEADTSKWQTRLYQPVK